MRTRARRGITCLVSLVAIDGSERGMTSVPRLPLVRLDRRPHNGQNGYMAEATLWFCIVDVGPAVLKALSRLLSSHSFRVQTYRWDGTFSRRCEAVFRCAYCRFPHA